MGVDGERLVLLRETLDAYGAAVYLARHGEPPERVADHLFELWEAAQ